MMHAPLWLAGCLAGRAVDRMARCLRRAEPFQQHATCYLWGYRMLLALHLLQLPSAGTLRITQNMGRVGGFPREKDPQHRAPQLSRQAPNQL